MSFALHLPPSPPHSPFWLSSSTSTTTSSASSSSASTAATASKSTSTFYSHKQHRAKLAKSAKATITQTLTHVLTMCNLPILLVVLFITVVAETASGPTFLDKFTDQTLEPGPSVSLRCIASGHPLPQVTWLVNGQPVPDHTRFRTGDYVTRDLVVVSYVNISSVTAQDGGIYVSIFFPFFFSLFAYFSLYFCLLLPFSLLSSFPLSILSLVVTSWSRDSALLL